jgi:hypothetical protein
MDLCHAVGDAREIPDIGGSVAILVRALWKRWRMFRRVALGRADSVWCVAAVSPVVTSVAGEIADVLMTCLFVCTGVADALGNSG